MYRWHAFSYEWFCTKTRFARGKSQLFIHELLREPLIYFAIYICYLHFYILYQMSKSIFNSKSNSKSNSNSNSNSNANSMVLDSHSRRLLKPFAPTVGFIHVIKVIP